MHRARAAHARNYHPFLVILARVFRREFQLTGALSDRWGIFLCFHPVVVGLVNRPIRGEKLKILMTQNRATYEQIRPCKHACTKFSILVSTGLQLSTVGYIYSVR